ncbi:hypothetical protein HW511_10550 [Asaia siamensis]|uniref:Uncharacterized protein n=1 Tax=Asaia siamensis TaxID=110479 RepID=A0ABQ1M826_9PROT|nr:hypothetical protein [Asaia siamensis]GBR10254.1 hypothetical protein AA0323_2755 [Asaia siamensis NRIC 0323]GGC33100.1 hypothetical protein GCM10007207_18190 [Asaia siamensis]
MKKIDTIPNIKDPIKYTNWLGPCINDSESPLVFYMSYNCNPSDCIVFSKVLFPEFFLLNDYVFARVAISPEAAKKGMEDSKNKKFDEESFNQIYIFELFDGNKIRVDDDIAKDIGKIIAFSWDLSLKKTFPDRNFVVNYIDDESNYGPIVNFYEIRG